MEATTRGSIRSPLSSSSSPAGSLRRDAGVISRARSEERGTVRDCAPRALPARRRGVAAMRESSAAISGRARVARPVTKRPRARAGVHRRSHRARNGRARAGTALHQLYIWAARRRRNDLACAETSRATASGLSASSHRVEAWVGSIPGVIDVRAWRTRARGATMTRYPAR